LKNNLDYREGDLKPRWRGNWMQKNKQSGPGGIWLPRSRTSRLA